MIDIRRINIGENINIKQNVEIDISSDFGVGKTVEIAVCGKLSNMGKFFQLEACGECILHVGCSRCLADDEMPIKFQIFEKFAEMGDADEDDIIFTNKMIDMRFAVERGLLVNIPMKPLCKDSCEGLCHKCGHNLNLGTCSCDGEINEQFRQLLQLFEDKEV